MPDSREPKNQPTDDESKSTIDVRNLQKKASLSDMQGDEIRLHLPERDDPIVFRNKVQITLGRKDKKRGIKPDVDLTTDHGSSLGVSRKHAEIRKVNDMYYIVDMDSSNGTFVNDMQIQPFRPRPLENGDQIRLGQFMMLVQIPTSANTAAAQGEAQPTSKSSRGTTIKISSPHNERLFMQNGIAFNFMTDFLSTYLNAVEELHTIIRTAQDKETEPLIIETLLLDVTQKMIVLQVRGGSDTVEFLQKKLVPFVEEEKKLVQDGGTQLYQSEAGTSAKTIATEDLAERVANHMLQEVVFRFLQDEREHYVHELAQPLRVVLASDLRMTAY